MATREKTIEEIYDRGEEIVESSRLARYVLPYVDLQREYETRGVTDDFREMYLSYYRMNGPMTCSDAYKEETFRILSEARDGGVPSFEDAASRLYDVDGRHMFSYVSKAVHTADTSVPAFDNSVARLLGFRKPGGAGKEAKIAESRKTLDEMTAFYGSLREDEKFSAVLDIFSEVFCNYKTLSYVKRCEFIFWSYADLES